MKIEVLLPNPVGDLVMATPALRALREHFASAHITYVGRPQALATMAGTPWADRLMPDLSAISMVGFLRQMLVLRRERFDLAILMRGSLRSALLAQLGGVRRVVGYNDHRRRWLLDDMLNPPRDSKGNIIPNPAIDHWNRLMSLVGVNCASHRMEVPVRQEDEQAAEDLLEAEGVDRSRPLVMLNPGAAGGVSKLWPAHRYGALADALIERRGVQIIVNTAPVERAVALRVRAAMRHKPTIDFTRRDSTLGLLKGLMRRTTLLVTNDTGARHIAAATGTRVLTIFGSTDPNWTTLYYDRERAVRTEVDCSPCQESTCRQSSAELRYQCMASIPMHTVLAAAEEMLDMC